MESALSYLDSCHVYGKKCGFDVLLKLLSMLDNPQDRLKIIHVAGTNGKGSVCAMLSSILSCQGYKTGFFSSPHLTSYNERFNINGELISEEDFSEGIKAVRDSVFIMLGENKYISHFEVLTCACFYYFAKKQVDFLLLEAGIGGEDDATNVIESPILSVITSISLDHTDILGDTISEIACHKAGIIKKNLPSVLYFSTKEVYNVVKAKCDNIGARLFSFDNLEVSVSEMGFSKTIFSVACQYFRYDKVELSMIGKHQIDNAATVLLCVYALRKSNISISENAVLEGLKNAEWPGRMEIVHKNPIVMLDGAHNLDGIVMLEKNISKLFRNKPLTIVTGVLKDKDFTDIAGVLASCADVLIVTEPSYEKRALGAYELYECVIENAARLPRIIVVEPCYKKALKTAMEYENDILVAGSLYLIGDVRSLIRVLS